MLLHVFITANIYVSNTAYTFNNCFLIIEVSLKEAKESSTFDTSTTILVSDLTEDYC